MVTIAGASAYSIVVSCTVIFLFFSFAVPIALGLIGLRQDLDQDGSVEYRRAIVQAGRGAGDPRGGAHLRHRRAAAERLGALDHRRLHRAGRDHLGRVGAASLPGPADRRHHRQAAGRDARRGAGRRRGLA